MVDSTGAVLLETLLPAQRVGAVQRNLLRQPAPREAVQLLFMASVVQGLAIHVRRGRGEAFGMDTRNIDTLTVAQLAAFTRTHQGQAGQGFELAVADGLNAGLVGVLEPVREALSSAGVPMATPRAVVMGLEKASDSRALADAVVAALGSRTLRTGNRGRPLLASRAVTRLLEGGTAIAGSRGELAFADLLVFDEDGEHVVTASVKISDRWGKIPEQAPRLWITTRTGLGHPRLPPRCAVATVGDEVLLAFSRAHERVMWALRQLDLLGRVPNLADNLAFRVMNAHRDAPVRGLLQELHDRARTILVDGYDMPWPDPPAPQDGRLHLLTFATEGEDRLGLPDGDVTSLDLVSVYGMRAAVQPHEQFFAHAYGTSGPP